MSRQVIHSARLAVQKAIVLNQEGGIIYHVNWTTLEWLLQLRPSQLKFFSMMGCFIGALVLIGKLRQYFRLYQAKRIEKTIYVKSSQSNILTGKHGRRKKKGIINKSGVEDIQINIPSDSEDYLSVHVSRK